MTLRKYLYLMSIASLICWAAWLLVVFNLNPQTVGIIGFLFFYASLFLAVTGTLAVIGFAIRTRLLKQELAFRHVAVSFRQATWFGLLVVMSLVLQSHGWLSWFNWLLMILLLLVLEFFFLSMKSNHYNH